MMASCPPHRRPSLTLAVLPAILGTLVLAMLFVTIRAQGQADDAAEAISSYRETNQQLARSEQRLAKLIDDRGSVVAHMICVDRLIAAYAILVTADPATHSDAIRTAATRLLAGLDPDSGVCPPMLEN